MSKGKPNPNWKQIVLDWKSSGKSRKQWCLEKKLSMHTLWAWKKRLDSIENPMIEKGCQKPFVELKDSYSDSGIILEVNGIKIHLKSNFDNVVLSQCIEVLRGRGC